MPIYFNDVAPFCPVSRDQPTGPMQAPTIPIRTMIPRAHDLPSAIAAVNILRSIISQIVTHKTINNVYGGEVRGGGSSGNRTIDKTRTTRWSEQKSKRIKRRYKYYAKGSDGNEDKTSWVMTERIERMVWYDAGWKSYLEFKYGDKGEGEPVPPSGTAAASEE